MANEDIKLIGQVTHYYSNIGVGIIKLTGDLSIGDAVHIEGNSSDLEMEVSSMQVNHESVESAGKGDEVGVKVSEKVKKGDRVYKR